MCYPRFVICFIDQTIGSRVVMCRRAINPWRLEDESRLAVQDSGAISCESVCQFLSLAYTAWTRRRDRVGNARQ